MISSDVKGITSLTQKLAYAFDIKMLGNFQYFLDTKVVYSC